MNDFSITQIFTNSVVLTWILIILMLAVTGIILFLWISNKKTTQPTSSINASETNTFRLMTAEEVSASAGAATGGLSRSHAFEFLSKHLPSQGDLVTGVTKTPIGSVSDWHFHPNWATIAYVLQGNIRVEFGEKGESAVEAGPGDFLFVPSGSGNNIHREKNIGEGEQILIVFRVGTGIVATAVDSPAMV
jgi:uncharacterized RmlC-like cupin family protein